MSDFHTPVFSEEVLTFLQVKKDGKYIDATLGGGGHTRLILNAGGKVLGIDQDEDALAYVKKNLESRIQNSELIVVKGNFREIGEIARSHGFAQVDGILFDLGVSSFQLDNKERGFSFLGNAELDMRMDKDLGVKAKDLVNALSRKELTMLFEKYGEEGNAWQIAGRIIEARLHKPIETTTELAEIISQGRRFKGGIHPATKVFQALRIAINDELKSLEEALPQAVELLSQKGRLAVISFHSLEDRIVKQTLRQFEDNVKGKILTQKPIVASEKEQQVNPRSRSAKLRVFEKGVV